MAEVFVLCGTGFASVVSRDGVADHWQSQCHTHKVGGKMLHSVPLRGMLFWLVTHSTKKAGPKAGFSLFLTHQDRVAHFVSNT
jgi:hypothetical protein